MSDALRGDYFVNTTLSHRVIGNGEHRLVFVHGFTQTRDAWLPVVTELTTRTTAMQCVLVDLPGHGGSSSVSADLENAARLLLDVGGRATYLGYSLGARVVIEALTQRPELVQRAVLVSANAGIEEPVERDARAVSDDALAARIETVGVEIFLREWLAQPLFSDLTPTQSMFESRLRNTASGLSDSLRRCSQGRQRPRWAELALSDVPILTIAGARDTKYVALARRLAATIPRGTLRVIAGAGHCTILESPQQVAEEIHYWMTSPSE